MPCRLARRGRLPGVEKKSSAYRVEIVVGQIYSSVLSPSRCRFWPSPTETHREAVAGVVQPAISQIEAEELALSDLN